MKKSLPACLVMIKTTLLTIAKGISTFQIWPKGGCDGDVEQRPPMHYWPVSHTGRSDSQPDRVQGKEQPQASSGGVPGRPIRKGRRQR